MKLFTTQVANDSKEGLYWCRWAYKERTAAYIFREMEQLARENGLEIHSFNTGLDYQGVSLGSPTFKNIEKPKVALLVGEGVSSYEAGEVWHLFDQRYHIDLSLIPLRVFNRASLDRYNTIIMVNGRYTGINTLAKEKLRDWVKKRGNASDHEKCDEICVRPGTWGDSNLNLPGARILLVLCRMQISVNSTGPKK